MGLSSAIAGGIVMVTMIYVLLIMPGVVDKSSSVQDSVSIISNVEKIISDTSISFSSISPSQGTDLFTSVILNGGTEKLWNFQKFDYIITYNSTTTGKTTESLTYQGKCSGGNPSVGKWCVDSITTDVVDPNILNEQESMTIKGRLSKNVATGIFITLFSTDHGVFTTSSTTVT